MENDNYGVPTPTTKEEIEQACKEFANQNYIFTITNTTDNLID